MKARSLQGAPLYPFCHRANLGTKVWVLYRTEFQRPLPGSIHTTNRNPLKLFVPVEVWDRLSAYTLDAAWGTITLWQIFHPETVQVTGSPTMCIKFELQSLTSLSNESTHSQAGIYNLLKNVVPLFSVFHFWIFEKECVFFGWVNVSFFDNIRSTFCFNYMLQCRPDVTFLSMVTLVWSYHYCDGDGVYLRHDTS